MSRHTTPGNSFLLIVVISSSSQITVEVRLTLVQLTQMINTHPYQGQGFGSNFARAAQGGMGTVDWSDCMSMLSSVISEGLADPKRLGIGGWSQGGFLTAWGVSQTKNVFKAGVMGAGVSDWGAMAAESDMPEFEVRYSFILSLNINKSTHLLFFLGRPWWRCPVGYLGAQ